MTVGSALSHAPCIGQHSRSAFTGVARRYLLEQHARLRIDAVAQGQPEISTLLFFSAISYAALKTQPLWVVNPIPRLECQVYRFGLSADLCCTASQADER